MGESGLSIVTPELPDMGGLGMASTVSMLIYQIVKYPRDGAPVRTAAAQFIGYLNN